MTRTATQVLTAKFLDGLLSILAFHIHFVHLEYLQQNLEFLNMFITGFTDLIDSFKFSNERFWQHSTADFNKSLKGRVFC